MDSREQFEKYYLKKHPRRFTGKNTIQDIRAIRYGDGYWAEGNCQFHGISDEWQAWQEAWRAGRAAIEITMPSRIENINLRTPLEVEDMWKHRLIYAAKEAGITVKGE